MIYLDNAATTPVSEYAIQKMLPFFEKEYANPSAAYEMGERAKYALEESRKKIAYTLNCMPQEIYFTSGGTESNNWTVNYAGIKPKSHIITSKIEHHAILNPCKRLEEAGNEITYLEVDENGRINPKHVEESIRSNTVLISIMTANNEIGTIEPIEEIGKIARKHNIIFHTDAVQAYAHIPINVRKSNIDMLSASGHKFNGPKGVGFLYIRNGIKIPPLILGGGQERGERSGTENVAGIVGMTEASMINHKNMKEKFTKEKNMRDYIINRVLSEIPDSRINGDIKNRLSNNVSISFKNMEGPGLVKMLNMAGICCSAGSACSAKKGEMSYVIKALNIPSDYGRGTIRITLSEKNTKEEIDYFLWQLKKILSEFYRY